MAGTVLGSLFSKSQTIFTSDLGSLMWAGVKVAKVTISPEAEVTDSPVQITVTEASGTSGQAVADAETIKLELAPYKIITAAKVEVELFCRTIDALTDLIQSFSDNTLLVNMVSKSATVRNLAMVGMHITNNPKIMNATRVSVSFEQAPPKGDGTVAPEQAADSDALGAGTVPLSSPPPTLPDVFAKLQDNIRSLF